MNTFHKLQIIWTLAFLLVGTACSKNEVELKTEGQLIHEAEGLLTQLEGDVDLFERSWNIYLSPKRFQKSSAENYVWSYLPKASREFVVHQLKVFSRRASRFLHITRHAHMRGDIISEKDRRAWAASQRYAEMYLESERRFEIESAQ